MHALERVGSGASDLPARRDIARERDHRDLRVAHQTGSGGLTVTVDHVQDARRKVLRADLPEDRGRQRRLLGGLEHDAVARRERRADLPDGHHQRVVPGSDLTDDADRLAPQHRRVARHVLPCGAALEAACGAGEEAQVVDDHWDLVAGRLQRLADVGGLEARELLATLLDRRGDRQQRARTLSRRRLRPPAEGRVGRLHGRVDVGGSRARRRGDRLAGRRVEDLLAAAVGDGARLASDQVLDLGERCRHCDGLPPISKKY